MNNTKKFTAEKTKIIKKCEYYHDCCDCGTEDEDNGCGCPHCWSCNACEECKNDNEELCENF